MRLHLDKENFVELIEQLYQRYGYKMVVLEKDYYVTMLLKELSEKSPPELTFSKEELPYTRLLRQFDAIPKILISPWKHPIV